jgi:hypothetical protein
MSAGRIITKFKPILLSRTINIRLEYCCVNLFYLFYNNISKTVLKSKEQHPFWTGKWKSVVAFLVKSISFFFLINRKKSTNWCNMVHFMFRWVLSACFLPIWTSKINFRHGFDIWEQGWFYKYYDVKDMWKKNHGEVNKSVQAIWVCGLHQWGVKH